MSANETRGWMSRWEVLLVLPIALGMVVVAALLWLPERTAAQAPERGEGVIQAIEGLKTRLDKLQTRLNCVENNGPQVTAHVNTRTFAGADVGKSLPQHNCTVTRIKVPIKKNGKQEEVDVFHITFHGKFKAGYRVLVSGTSPLNQVRSHQSDSVDIRTFGLTEDLVMTDSGDPHELFVMIFGQFTPDQKIGTVTSCTPHPPAAAETKP